MCPLAQVSTRLKLGVMFDHNGTYMDGVGFQYLDHTVTIEITPENALAGGGPCLLAHSNCRLIAS